MIPSCVISKHMWSSKTLSFLLISFNRRILYHETHPRLKNLLKASSVHTLDVALKLNFAFEDLCIFEHSFADIFVLKRD